VQDVNLAPRHQCPTFTVSNCSLHFVSATG
jgi:hypothetical protein